MIVESPFLAAENSADERRTRAFYRFVVASPVVLLVAVGLVGHLHRPAFAGVVASAEYDRRVLAFRERVGAAERATAKTTGSETAAVREAKAWVDGFARGELGALPPAAFEDHLREGVRGEIVARGLSLASKVVQSADRAITAGDPLLAAQRALLGAQAIAPLGGSELIANVQTVMTERRCIDVVAEAWPRLPPSAKPGFRRRLLTLKVDPEEIERLAALEIGQLDDYVRRQGPEGIGLATPVRGLVARKLRAARHNASEHNARIERILRAD